MTLRLNVQKLEIKGAILIGKEDILPVVAALSDVVRRTGGVQIEVGEAYQVSGWAAGCFLLNVNASPLTLECLDSDCLYCALPLRHEN
jgi:hypothetical protein